MSVFDATQQLLGAALQGESLRQDVLSNNLANANTAGFKRSDVDFASTLDNAISQGSNAVSNVTFTPKVDASGSIDADGNNVDVATEVADMNENSLLYQTTAEIAKARLHMLEIAAGSH